MPNIFDAYIISTGVALPGDPLDNEVVARKFGASVQWIEMFVGTRQRYLAMDLDTGRVTHTLADLGAEAGAASTCDEEMSGRPIGVTKPPLRAVSIIERRNGFWSYEMRTMYTLHSRPISLHANASALPHCPAPVSVESRVRPSRLL